MKPFYLLILICVFTSCGGTKKAIEKQSKPVATHTENPKQKKKDTLIIEPQVVVKVLKDTITSQKPIAAVITPKKVVIKKPSHSEFDALLKKHVSNKGNVDYKGFKNDAKKLRSYISYLGNHLPDNTWSKNEKLAYWINAYNAMTIDLILRHYPIKSIKDIKDPWKQRFWKLGEKWYNLNEIEHEILRKMNDPRIHFAIVCASYSCPKLQNTAFNALNTERLLMKATKDFLSDSERNSISKNDLELSKIFQWFSKDFKLNGSIIDFLNKYSDIMISNNAKKRFKDYNWNLNE